jgi:hydroxypyruvate isomerase
MTFPKRVSPWTSTSLCARDHGSSSTDQSAIIRHSTHDFTRSGTVIATIRKQNAYFAHYHTGGVPGRHEIDETQELNYPAILRAIVDTGYKGFVAQEFIPARPDALGSLRQAVRLCDV